MAALALAGLRISEALDLNWRDLNLAGRKLRVIDAKPDAGVHTYDHRFAEIFAAIGLG